MVLKINIKNFLPHNLFCMLAPLNTSSKINTSQDLNLIDTKTKKFISSVKNSKKIFKTSPNEDKENLNTNSQYEIAQKKIPNSPKKSSIFLKENIPSTESKTNQVLAEVQNTDKVNNQDFSSKSNEDILKTDEEKNQRSDSVDFLLKVKPDKSTVSEKKIDIDEIFKSTKYPSYSKKRERNFGFSYQSRVHPRLFLDQQNRKAYQAHKYSLRLNFRMPFQHSNHIDSKLQNKDSPLSSFHNFNSLPSKTRSGRPFKNGVGIFENHQSIHKNLLASKFIKIPQEIFLKIGQPPRKPLSAYRLFIKEKYTQLKKESGLMPHLSLMKQAHDCWLYETDEEIRNTYFQKYSNNLKDFTLEIAEFHKHREILIQEFAQQKMEESKSQETKQQNKEINVNEKDDADKKQKVKFHAPFKLFKLDCISKMKEEFPNLTSKERTQKLKSNWKALNSNEKYLYVQRSRLDKQK